MDADVDFDGFVSARWVRLYLLAYLLTTDDAAAEDLLQTAMEKSWTRTGGCGRSQIRIVPRARGLTMRDRRECETRCLHRASRCNIPETQRRGRRNPHP